MSVEKPQFPCGWGCHLGRGGKKTGFSLPTVSALAKAYANGGWSAVGAKKRGRPKGGNKEAAKVQTDLRSAFLEECSVANGIGQVFSISNLITWLTQKTNQPTNQRTVIRRLAEWGFLPPDDPSHVGTLCPDAHTAIFWARGPKNEIFIMPSRLPLTDTAYCAIFQTLENHFPKDLTVRLHFAGMQYTPLLAAWLSKRPHFQLKQSSEEDQSIPPKKKRSITIRRCSANESRA